MKLRRLALALILAGNFLLAGCYFGQGSVQGYVYTLSESPGVVQIGGTLPSGSTAIADAAISVPGFAGYVHTDLQGRFQLEGIDAGPHAILATTPDGRMTQRKVIIERDQVVSNFLLPTWTMLVYMPYDSYLWAHDDMKEMVKAGSSADLNVIVQSEDLLDCDRQYIIRDRALTVEALANAEMSDSATLADFVTWGATRFPAEHVMLILWDHELDFLHEFSNNGLTAGAVRTALNSARQTAGVKVDVIAFDSDPLQALEVGYELQGQADYLVGTESALPEYGFPYDTIMQGFEEGMTPNEAARMVSGRVIGLYSHWAGAQACMSVIDLSHWSDFTSRMKGFAAALSSASDGELTLIRASIDHVLPFDEGINVDLYDFAERIADLPVNSSLKAAAEGVTQNWSLVVIANGRTDFLDHERIGHGLAILLDDQSSGYYQMRWAVDSQWNEFLAKLSL